MRYGNGLISENKKQNTYNMYKEKKKPLVWQNPLIH